MWMGRSLSFSGHNLTLGARFGRPSPPAMGSLPGPKRRPRELRPQPGSARWVPSKCLPTDARTTIEVLETGGVPVIFFGYRDLLKDNGDQRV